MSAATLHGAWLQVWAEVGPSPSPSVQEIPPADQTSPGLIGFLVTFGVAIAVMLLGYSLVRKLRRVERRGRQLEAEERAAAEAARQESSGGPADGARGERSGGPEGTRTDADPGADGVDPR
ncbi:hypothetical protein [Cellulomonas sp. RIT-PI-Y]|uniref:hypothetical protein n=1 Tax=Cellulomonas sp. RIT-PI-Y TaxID=3035297 RepID=UPI0021DB2935|nr:hypothetical protein [Cellulomonas sp. RIT-PI-Y]